MTKASLFAIDQFSGKSLFFFDLEDGTTVEAFGSPLWVSKVAGHEFPIDCRVDIARNIKGRIFDKETNAKFSTTHNSVERLVPMGISGKPMPTQSAEKQGDKAF